MNRTTSDSDYLHGSEAPCTSGFIHEPVKIVLQNLQAKTVLDIGCGNGHLAKYLKNGGVNVVGIDPSESGINNARLLLPDNKFYCMGIYDDPKEIEETNFDAVVSTEVIEHLFYPRELLRFAKVKIKPNGYLLLTTPYHGYLKNLVLSIFNAWDKHHTPFWDGGHIKFWSKKTLSRLLVEEGYEVKDFIGCGRFPYLWKTMLLIAQSK